MTSAPEPPPPPAAGPAGRERGRARRGPPAAPGPQRTDGRWPAWAAFLAGAALVTLTYGALRPEGPTRRAARPAAARSEHAAPPPSPGARRGRATASRQGALRPSAPWLPRGADAGASPGGVDDTGAVGDTQPTRATTERAPAAPSRASRQLGATPDAGRHAAALPPGHPALDEPPDVEDEGEAPAAVRRLELNVLTRWQQPGLCAGAGEAAAARRAMLARFRRVDWEPDAMLFLDPRLAAGAPRDLFESLELAEQELATALDLRPARPDVFAYRDTQLLLAGGCTNDGVVAYYDGDLHVVATHADVQQSIIHEYTHHALMSSGLVAPAWAQEGIAMSVAGETWWQTHEWLDRVAARPFALDVMERAVPYTLTTEHALSFYVQAAAMVQCAALDEPDGLRGLVRRLRAGGPSGVLEYELPALAAPAALRACARELLD